MTGNRPMFYDHGNYTTHGRPSSGRHSRSGPVITMKIERRPSNLFVLRASKDFLIDGFSSPYMALARPSAFPAEAEMMDCGRPVSKNAIAPAGQGLFIFGSRWILRSPSIPQQPRHRHIKPCKFRGFGWTLRISSGTSEGICKWMVPSDRGFLNIWVSCRQ